MNEILRNKLYLGDMFDANNIEMLRANNITSIVSVAERLKININEPNIKIYKYELSDDYECDILKYFDEICEIINKENIVLVNCVAGVSRSATIILAYLMKYYNMSLKDSFIYVRKRRDRICPNKHFMKCLLDYELTIIGKNSLTYEECVKLFYYT